MKLLLTIILMKSLVVFAQQEVVIPESYTRKIALGDSLSELQEFSAASKAYAEAFKNFRNRGIDVDFYKAARADALGGALDSAKSRLRSLGKLRYYNYKKLQSDSAFIVLRSSSDWNSIIDTVKRNKSRFAPNLNLDLSDQLDSLIEVDQYYRAEIDKALMNGQRDLTDLQSRMRAVDSSNTLWVIKFLDTNGWLGEDVVGMGGNATLFFLIQHATLETQERYLPMLQEAVRSGNAKGRHLALLEDRISVARKGYQIYGSQLFTKDAAKNEYALFPIQDEPNVDKRRLSVGLEPLAEYLKHWNMVYKPVK